MEKGLKCQCHPWVNSDFQKKIISPMPTIGFPWKIENIVDVIHMFFHGFLFSVWMSSIGYSMVIPFQTWVPPIGEGGTDKKWNGPLYIISTLYFCRL